MIVPLLPLFLSGVLLADMAVIGFIDGVAEGTANILKGVSGFVTDRVEKKRKLLIIGYGISAISKPAMAFAGHWGVMLGARFTDRIGKGIRTSPRDYLLSSSVDEKVRGQAFGFHRAMDTFGALIGATLALLLLIFFSSNSDFFRGVFFLAFFPAIVGVACLFLFKEQAQKIEKRHIRDKPSLPKAYWVFLIVGCLYSVIQLTPAFLILRTKQLFEDNPSQWWPIIGSNASLTFAVFGFLVFNLVYVITSTKMGSSSDKYGRIPVLTFGAVVLILILMVFAFITVPELALVAMALFGLYIASTEGVLKARIADMTKGDLLLVRGTAYGWFNLTNGLTILVAASLFGILWDTFGPTAAYFLYGVYGIIPLSGLLGLFFHERRVTGISSG